MCLGVTHAMSGLVAGVATLPASGVQGPVMQAGWVAACGGYAMLPDLDQRGATISRMWGFLTDVAAGAVGRVAGGHRWGTHDLVLAPILFGAVASAAAAWTPTRVLAVAVGLGLALKAVHFAVPGRAEHTVIGNLVLSWLGAWLLTSEAGPDLGWMPAAVFVGVVTHLAGDALSKAGLPVPLAWPFLRGRRRKGRKRWWSDGRMELPSARLGRLRVGAFTTGHTFERWVIFPGCVLALVLLTAQHVGVADDVAALVEHAQRYDPATQRVDGP